MNREEAIEWIKELIKLRKEETDPNKFYSDPEYADEVYEALDMAINALKPLQVGAKVKTIKDVDSFGNQVFPIGTVGIITEIRQEINEPQPEIYKVYTYNDFWWYSADMLELVEDTK